jgi:hypothetical protein
VPVFTKETTADPFWIMPPKELEALETPTVTVGEPEAEEVT